MRTPPRRSGGVEFRVEAPWSVEQVRNLNDYQAGLLPPYTCPQDCGEPAVRLVATVGGWRCPACAYTQNWAHLYAADTDWKALSLRPIKPDDGM